jgi:hypothetical protein
MVECSLLLVERAVHERGVRFNESMRGGSAGVAHCNWSREVEFDHHSVEQTTHFVDTRYEINHL